MTIFRFSIAFHKFKNNILQNCLCLNCCIAGRVVALTILLQDFTFSGRIIMCIALFILQGHKITVVNTSLYVCNVHGSVHRNNILLYIQQDATLYSLFYLETALHVSGGTITHHQERIQLYLQHMLLSHRYCYLPLSWKSWNWFEFT
jgi:hypothetical protein